MNSSLKTALITGGNGNLGCLLSERLVQLGVQVIKFDIPGTEPQTNHPLETIEIGDIRDQDALTRVMSVHQPDAIYHLASLLSGSSESDVTAAWEINATASFKLMQLAVEYQVKMFFFASTIASYGREILDPMPEDAAQWPENFYGATKVAVERLGVYYKQKHNLDFRCLRFPLVISPFAPPTAVTAFPSHAFRAAMDGKPFTFPVSPEIGMSTLFLEDVINSMMSFSLSDKSNLKQHAYNVHAYFVSAQMVELAIKQKFPEFKCEYQPQENVETLLSNWPNIMIDDAARSDWGWRPAFDFQQSAEKMWELLQS